MVQAPREWLLMWVDGDGRSHTVAAPDWRSVVQVEKKVMRRLRRQEWFETWVEERQESFLERVAAGVFGEGGEQGELPPRPFLLTAEDVDGPIRADAWLQNVDEWWKLDVLLALEDALDG